MHQIFTIARNLSLFETTWGTKRELGPANVLQTTVATPFNISLSFYHEDIFF